MILKKKPFPKKRKTGGDTPKPKKKPWLRRDKNVFVTIIRKLDKMAEDLQVRFDTLSQQLTTTGEKQAEASKEILSELTKFRESIGTLTPEQEASLQRVETQANAVLAAANAMADISPPVE